MPGSVLKNTLLFLCIIFCQGSHGQNKNKLAFGLNITHFGDWKNRPFNFFNPGIRYMKALKQNSFIDMGLNVFYSQAVARDFTDPGDVFQRLIFTTDIAYKRHFNNFSALIGPSLRYRNEKIRAACTSCPAWEFRISPKKGFVDVGAVAGLNYEFLLQKRSSFEFRLAYRLYNKGVNPLSLGIFYNRYL